MSGLAKNVMRRRALWACAATAATVVVLGGCAGWQSWPARGNEPTLSPNSAAALDVMEASLRWAMERRPPKEHDGPVALNLPVGLTELAYQGVARDVGYGTVPLSTKTADLPIYHIAAFRLRLDQAQVELLRPALPADAYTDELRRDPEAYEGYILTLKGQIGGWKVEWFRERSPGVIGVPEFNFIDVPREPALTGEEADEPTDGADETGQDAEDAAEAARRARETATGG